jgi:hypothetical protein
VNVKDKISALQALDLSTYPFEEVNQLLGSMGSVAAIDTRLHPGQTIMRVRPNFNSERFETTEQISYKPAYLNTLYQRASCPNTSVFYGSTVSEKLKDGELNLMRLIGLFEAVTMMRDRTSVGEQIITFSKWKVIKEIPLISIIHHKGFNRNNSAAEEQRINYENFLSSLSAEMAENSRLFTDYLSGEFAKSITPNDYDYFISAIYTHMVTYHGHAAGVLYPSVRTEGDGFNVAIHPHFLDNNYLIPTVVGECTIYKNGDQAFLDNETFALLTTGQTKFELKPVERKYHAGREFALNAIRPYWCKLLLHFEKKGYIHNGLTVPFLIGAREIMEPNETLLSIRELMISISLNGGTILKCPNINEYVIGTVDSETLGFKSVYPKLIEEIIVTDTSLELVNTLEELIAYFESLYSIYIETSDYSKNFGIWSYFTEIEQAHINEINDRAIN